MPSKFVPPQLRLWVVEYSRPLVSAGEWFQEPPRMSKWISDPAILKSLMQNGRVLSTVLGWSLLARLKSDSEFTGDVTKYWRAYIRLVSYKVDVFCPSCPLVSLCVSILFIQNIRQATNKQCLRCSRHCSECFRPILSELDNILPCEANIPQEKDPLT